MKEGSEKNFVDIVYQKIILLALTLHIVYIGIFVYLDVSALILYNVFSVIFYMVMQWLVKKGYFPWVVSCIHIEVCVFTAISTLFIGWEAGYPFYLVALASLTYFCPFERKYIPYIFSILEIIIFFMLKFYTESHHMQIVEFLPYHFLLYIFNALASFIIIIYAAFSSQVSAIVSQKKLEDENENLTHMANYDELTGLLNRHGMIERMKESHVDSFVLVIGDIDDFKVINDTWGHTIGDHILCETADIFKKQFNGIADVCRWGGEEFIFLFYNIEKRNVVQMIEDLRQIVENHTYQYNHISIHMTMTFGVSTYTEAMTLDEVIAIADRRMYQGKDSGKNRVMYAFDEE